MHALVLAVVIAWTPPPMTLDVTAITPSIGRPQGGEVLRIQGRGFRPPVRVFFDVGGAFAIESAVISVSDTTIDLVSPPIAFAPGEQQRKAGVIVVAYAGMPAELRTRVEDGFTYRNEILEPKLLTASPNRGPIIGGTRVSIFGEGFQAPVQVLFDDVEARVLQVDYGQIVVETPAMPAPRIATLTVRNIGSQTASELRHAYRYQSLPIIRGITPSRGACTGGTTVRIEGTDLPIPASVHLAGVRATVIAHTSTSIIAVSGALPGPCTPTTGPVTILDLMNGNESSGARFTYAPDTNRRRSARH
jgi:hypothetical protein